MQPVYCEQPALSDYFEPINTLTNLFFIVAGIHLLIFLNGKKKLDAKGIYFSLLLIIVGLGSLAWHFYRTSTTLMLDSIPIAVFIISYLWFYLVKTVKKTIYRVLFFVGFFAYIILIIRTLHSISLPAFLGNGGLEYTVALSYFLIIQVYNYFNNPAFLKSALIIVLLFLTSIFFRQIDLLTCKAFGFGTHFLWHIFNSIVLYLFVRLLYK